MNKSERVKGTEKKQNELIVITMISDVFIDWQIQNNAEGALHYINERWGRRHTIEEYGLTKQRPLY